MWRGVASEHLSDPPIRGRAAKRCDDWHTRHLVTLASPALLPLPPRPPPQVPPQVPGGFLTCGGATRRQGGKAGRRGRETTPDWEQ
ncbi:hypothetical protein NDU88_004535 [Pleurodeles waltl]|uniref:Uncharacterized protein n=1 Tax=Pleurodeles waltl TaxID=8319 RepID=A0AAV7LLM1_PLEWA|nr:hypothetical protein NDU88_004535 [Pleurodeles waltl]